MKPITFKTISAFVFLFVIVFTNQLHAQMPRNMTVPTFNAKEAAGIIKYDSEKVIKKLKIANDSVKAQITKYISDYNREMDGLLLFHSKTLDQLENAFNANVKIAIQKRDRSQMEGVKAKIKETILPIRSEIYLHEKTLNEAIQAVLTEDENASWLKYQNNKKTNSNF